jgi:hypothetical protein
MPPHLRNLNKAGIMPSFSIEDLRPRGFFNAWKQGTG